MNAMKYVGNKPANHELNNIELTILEQRWKHTYLMKC